jgi:predicted membrane-bound spermidine synthase
LSGSTADFAADFPLTYAQLREAVAGRTLHSVRMDVLQDDAGPFLRLTAVLADGVLVLDSREPWQAGTVH